MKNKKLETILFSVAGVAAMFVILVALNYIAGLGKQRIDLTKEKLYTLSQGSKEIIGKIDGQVEIRFYCARGEKEILRAGRPMDKSAPVPKGWIDLACTRDQR